MSELVLSSDRDNLLLSLANQYGFSAQQIIAFVQDGTLEQQVMARATTDKVMRIYGVEYNLTPLDGEEFSYFVESFLNVLNSVSSIERAIYVQRARYVMGLIGLVKMSGAGGATNARFKGFNPADNELGIQLIRPGHVGLATAIAGITYNNWIWGPGAAGGGGAAFPNAHAVGVSNWNNWIGTLAAPFRMGGALGSAGLIYMALVSNDGAPITSEVRDQIGQRADLNPVDVRRLAIFDNENQTQVYPIPTGIVPPRIGLFKELNLDRSGETEIALGGFTVGLGRYLRWRTYDALGDGLT